MVTKLDEQGPCSRPWPWLLLMTSTLGLIILTRHAVSLFKWIFITFLRQPKNLKTTYGSWALITGATDGIGRAFARQLAKQGLNLILVGRNNEKLQKVSDEVKAENPNTNIKIKTVELDFSSASDVEGAIEKALTDDDNGHGVEVEVDVSVLINNVGVTYPRAMFFHEVSEEVWMNIIRVNLEGTTRVTRAVIKRMVKRKKGAIVNMGSGAAIVVPSHPLFSIYAATKAYIDQLSRSLHVEYKRFGIDVQCQVPLYVATKMASTVASIQKQTVFVPSPEDYAEAAVRHVGYEPRCAPYWAHYLQWCLASFIPDSLLDTWRLSIGIRRRRKIEPLSL